MCPSCGTALEIVADGQQPVDYFVAAEGRVEERLERRPFAACSRCEFCIDLAPAAEAMRREGR